MDEKDDTQPMVITVYSGSTEKNEAVEYLEWTLANKVTLVSCKRALELYLAINPID